MFTFYTSDGKKDERFDSRGNGFPIYCKFHRIEYGTNYFYVWTMDNVLIDNVVHDQIVVNIPEPNLNLVDDKSFVVDPELLIFLRRNYFHQPLQDLCRGAEEFTPSLLFKLRLYLRKTNRYIRLLRRS